MRILRIGVNGSFELIDVPLEDAISRSFLKYIKEKGTGLFKQLEKFYEGNHHYTAYGYEEGYNFNMFDLACTNATGDILITCCLNNIPVDIEPQNVIAFYKGEDLDDTLIEDELEQEYLDDRLNDEYEYGDFVVRDDDEGQDYPDDVYVSDEDD